jgi:hypothetical protein
VKHPIATEIEKPAPVSGCGLFIWESASATHRPMFFLVIVPEKG